jgi:hypothetical protein
MPDAPGGSEDPFGVLGLDRHATVDEIRAARRRLALSYHPDRNLQGARRMQAINEAFDAAIGHATGRRLLGESSRSANGMHRPAPRPATRNQQWLSSRPQHDVPSFTIELLPVEAFEALLVVTSWMGQVLVDEPPYLLEVHIDDPQCWCRLELVPDAGAATVSPTVAGVDGAAAPDVEWIRDLWVANLNQLGEF